MTWSSRWLVATFCVAATLPAASICGVTASAATATTIGTVTEYSAGINVNAFPFGITTGPDGRLWFTEYGAHAVARMSIDGSVTEFVTVGGSPTQIVTGADGDLWFPEWGSRAIGRMTVNGTSNHFVDGISEDAQPYAITSGPDGALWFTDFTANIGRITTDGTVAEYPTAAGPWGITTGPDAAIWFTAPGTVSAIGRMSTTGHTILYRAGISADAWPTSITPGPDGALWFTENGTDGIGRITTTGEVTEYFAGISSGAQPWGIAAGPDGALWFTENGTDTIGRITTRGDVTEYSTGITAGAAPLLITLGPDGAMWFTEHETSTIGRIATGVPGHPLSVTAVAHAHRADVSWAAPTDTGASPISRYTVTARPGGHTCTSASTSCTVPGLTPGVGYRFAVTATNGIGTGPASASSRRTIAGAPGAPASPAVSFPRPGTARITWRAPAPSGRAGISGYQVRWSHGRGGTWTAWETTSVRATHHDRLTRGHRYVVQVRARNRWGPGPAASLAFTQKR
jgi:virginiamycin B lyase